MKKNQDQPPDDAALRRRAEERLKRQRPAGGGQTTKVETARLIHELQVHQIELEMQNEELQQARAHVETLLTQYTDLYDFALAGYLTLDREGAIRQVNVTGASLLGVERSRLVNRRFGVFVAEGDRRAFSDFLQRVFASHAKECCEVTLPQDGSQALVVQIKGTRSADGQECRAVVLDITERSRAEASLRESEAHYRAVMESANDAIITSDSAGIVQDWNPAAQRMFGYSEREARGQPLTLLIPERLAGQHLQGIHSMRDGANTHVMGTGVELEGLRKDGSVFPLELSLSEWSTPAGRRFTGVIHDITARKQAETEKAKLEVQYRQAQKMESIGRLAGGVAHDFNNMLGIISGYADLALMKLDPSGPMHADLQEVTKAAKRSADLVRQLLAFARQQAIAPRILDINETVERMLKLLRRLIGEDVDLFWKPGGDLWPVKMDPSQIDQILANLAVNARDAIAGTGKIVIESGTAIFNDAYCAAHPGAAPGRYVLLAVSDNGCGMDKDTQGQIFEPFFTTKAQGQGTGLGLSTVYGIVKQNLGFIDVYSEPGQGTTFRVYLPAHESAGEADAITPVSTESATGWETVLLVEDEEALLALCKRTLEQLGYTVLAAASPIHAIELFRNYPGEIHLLLTDVVMPEMSGRTLQQRLDELRPGLKCLFTSGYTADVIAHRGVLLEDVNFLQKPYSWQTLAAKVREVLGPPRSQTPSLATDGDMEIPV